MGGESIPRNLEYFSELYRSYYGDLVMFAEAILFDHEEARDVVQEVFCYIWDNSRSIEIRSDIRTYLFSSVKHRALNRLKHLDIIDKHFDRVREAWWFSMNVSPEEDALNLKRIRDVSEKFPEQMRRVFMLRTDENMKYEEIAGELGISVNSVKTHLRRAFSLLRKELLPIAVLLLCL